jgi:hypothetical protein
VLSLALLNPGAAMMITRNLLAAALAAAMLTAATTPAYAPQDGTHNPGVVPAGVAMVEPSARTSGQG